MKRPKSELVFEVVARVVALAGLIATAYCWLTYTGPFRWLAELQLALWDGYRPLFTGVMTLVAFTLLPVGLSYALLVRLRVLEAFDPSKLDRDSTAEQTASTGPLPYFVAGALFLGFAAGGAHQLWRGRGSDELRTYDVATLGEREPEAGYVTLTGRLAAESALVYQEEGRRRVEHTYVPLVRAAWQSTDPVRFLVEYRRYDGMPKLALPPAASDVRLTGTLHASDVPAFLLERAELRLSPRHYVLVPGEKPRQTRALGLSLIGGGAVLGALVASLTALGRRGRRRMAR